MIDLHDSRTPSLMEMPASELLAAYIEDVAFLVRVREEHFYDNSAVEEVRERRVAIASEIDRRMPVNEL